MSGIFSAALKNDILGAMFAVSVASPEMMSAMKLNEDEQELVRQCAECVEHIKKEGVPRSMLRTDNPKLKICKHIIHLKQADKIKKILRKFLKRLQTHPEERAALQNLSEEARPYINVPYSLPHEEWKSEIVYDYTSSSDDIMSGVSTLSWDES